MCDPVVDKTHSSNSLRVDFSKQLNFITFLVFKIDVRYKIFRKMKIKYINIYMWKKNMMLNWFNL